MENAQERLNEDMDIVESVVDGPVGLSDKFQTFREKEKINSDDEVMFYVYKFDSLTSNKRSLLDKTANEPDEHEIGCMYGSGKYDIFMTVKGKKSRSYQVVLHKRYDALMEEKRIAPQLPAVSGGSFMQGGMMEQLAGIRALIEVIKPLSNPTDPSMMMAAYGEMMKGMVKMSQQMISQSMEGILQMQNRFIGHDDDDDVEDVESEPEEQKDGVVELIQQYLPLIEQYLPKILQGGTQSKVLASTVRSLPIFKNLMRDRESLSVLIHFLKEQYGHEKTEALLVKLGLKKAREKAEGAPVNRPRRRNNRQVVESGIVQESIAGA